MGGAILKMAEREFLARIFKALAMGLLLFTVLYLIPNTLFPIEFYPKSIAVSYGFFIAVVVGFSSAMAFATDTIFYYAFGACRAFAIIFLVMFAFKGGMVEISMPLVAVQIKISIDLTVILVMMLIAEMLDVIKNVLGAIAFLSGES